MSNDNNSSSSGRLGLANILTIIFVIAKILGYVNWSWWLVFLPTILVVGFALILLIFVAIASLIK
jgi:hypothetical protein